MLYIKANYPSEKYELAFVSLWIAMWQNHIDISKPELMAKTLSENFTEAEIEKIIAAAQMKEYKDMLSENTKKVIELGAFGAPFFSVRNDEGKVEPFFGSDR
jgi:glutathione S-transferase kappa 1